MADLVRHLRKRALIRPDRPGSRAPSRSAAATPARISQSIRWTPWWQAATLPMFENVRKRLRSLVSLIERKDRRIVYTDFEDEMGAEVEVALQAFTPAGDFERFRAKARQFLKAHEDHIALRKLRSNKPLTPGDLAELERMLTESGGTAEDVRRASDVLRRHIRTSAPAAWRACSSRPTSRRSCRSSRRSGGARRRRAALRSDRARPEILAVAPSVVQYSVFNRRSRLPAIRAGQPV